MNVNFEKNSVQFLPQTNDALIATAAADRYIYCFDLTRVGEELCSPCWKCSCHNQRVKRLATVPDCPCIFWSAGEDGRILYEFKHFQKKKSSFFNKSL